VHKSRRHMKRLELRLRLGPLSAAREGLGRAYRRILATISFSRLRRRRRGRWLGRFAKFSEFLGRILAYGGGPTIGVFCGFHVMSMIRLSTQSRFKL